MNSYTLLWIASIFIAFNNVASSYHYMCSVNWSSNTANCWRVFNETDYCSANSICRFYGSKISTNEIATSNGVNSEFWLHDSILDNSLYNTTCADSNILQGVCPVLGLKDEIVHQPCNLSKKFICEKGILAKSLGMENNQVTDKQLSSSSFYQSETEPIGYKAKFARLNTEYITGTTSQGGWCSKTDLMHEYLQINLAKTVLLTKLMIQGVKGRTCSFWTTSLNLTYRNNVADWVKHAGNENGSISGNNNANDALMLDLQPSVFASEIRIHPTGYASDCLNAPGRYCLRVEVYGIDASSQMTLKLSDGNRNLDTYHSSKDFNTHYHKNEIIWPNGDYSLPKPQSGCPSPLHVSWLHGYRLQNYNLSDVAQSTSNHLQNNVSTTYYVEEFCTVFRKRGQTYPEGGQFPEGQYCVYRVGDACPQGFQSGSLKFFEDSSIGNKSWSHANGATPGMSYNYNESDTNCCYTEMHYCCRNDSTSSCLELPAGMPFYLLPMTNQCSNTTDASVSMEYFELPLGNGEKVLSEITSGLHPFITLSVVEDGAVKKSFIRYHLCYYKPLASAVNQLIVTSWNEDIVNANYQLEIKLALFTGKNVIQDGVDWNLKINVTSAECNVAPTSASFNFSSGVAVYDGGVSIDQHCRGPANATITFSALTPSGETFTVAKNITVISKTNIFVFVSKKSYNNIPELQSEIDSIVQQQEMKDIRLHVNVTVFVYENRSGIRRLFKNVTNKSPSHPENIHAIIAVNTPEVHDTLDSIAGAYRIPFIAGSTKSENLRTSAENSLQFTIKPNDTLSNSLQKMRHENISELILIRSAKHRIPISFAYYIMKYNITIRREIVMAEGGSRDSAKEQIKILNSLNIPVYFIVDTSTAKTLLISATQLAVGPSDGYTWLSGSNSGVYDSAVGSKECYKLKPRTCSKAFQGVLMPKGIGKTVDKESYINGLISNINYEELGNASSDIHIRLMKNMIYDGIDVVLNSIIHQIAANASINTRKIAEVVAKSELKRLPRMQLSSSDVDIDAGKDGGICANGWTGNNCSQASCVAYQCKTNKGTCVANGICECHPGQFGYDCSGNCANRCQKGVCNEGRLGDGSCEKCHWLYGGVYCNTAVVLKALIAACLGSLFIAVTGTCYLLRVCRPKQDSMLESEKDESTWILDWNTLTNLEKVNIDKAVAARHLAEKIPYTDYYKTKLYEKNVFVKCIKRRAVKLSLDVRLEIWKIIQLDHVNIEKLLGVCLGPPCVAIVTELANMGSLYDTLHAENFDVSLEIKYTFMEDICRGMMFLHDECGIAHGRLKSTNCLLHKGWRVKITEIGLSVLRKRINKNYIYRTQQNESEQNQNVQFADYNSLLWTAPEYLGSEITNIDQVENVLFGGDVYSFGILMAEIISRRAPYEEIKVMSTQHIIEAIAHLREPLVDLEVIRPGTSKSKRDMMLKPSAKILRPKITDDALPNDEPARSILRLLMESAWSDDPGDRPSFSHIKKVLKIIVPLKGDQMAKRAFLLEKETEMLEKYIAHDTSMIMKEREKLNDWFHRLLPTDVSQRYITGESVQPRLYDNITVAAFHIVDLNHIVKKSKANQLIPLLDYMLKMFYATANSQNFEISEFGVLSGTNVIGPIHTPTHPSRYLKTLLGNIICKNIPFPVSGNGASSETQVDQLVQFCLKILRASKNMQIVYKDGLKLNFKAAMHSGSAVGGLVLDCGKTPRYRMFGKVVTTTIQLAKKSEPNCLLMTEQSARMLRQKSGFRLIEAAKAYSKMVNTNQRIYWVPSQNIATAFS
eukprot:gene11022-12187_t